MSSARLGVLHKVGAGGGAAEADDDLVVVPRHEDLRRARRVLEDAAVLQAEERHGVAHLTHQGLHLRSARELVQLRLECCKHLTWLL